MSTVSPVPGAASVGAGLSNSTGPYSQQHPSQHNSGASHSHHHSHHPSSQDGAPTGMPHSSFDSVASHHGHQQQQQQQQQQQHNSHPSSAGPTGSSPWGHSQPVHYSNGAGAGYPSHTMYSPTGYYGPQSSHSNGSTNMGGGGYAAYSVQPHQGPPQQSIYGGHSTSSNTMNGSSGAHVGSTHHSGSSTPTSATPYSHHSHSMGSMFSNQPYHPHHPQSGSYYGMHNGAPSNSMMSPSYSSAPQYSTQLPLSGRHRVTTTLWEDEGTLCFQVDARGVCVARRHDNNMINGTKLLNVCGMSRGKRDGILKNEKERIVVKVGAMHLKGVWITFQRGKQLAEQNDILDVLYPLFETNIQSFLYHPDNYPRTAAVMAAAQERHAQRSRVSVGTSSPVNSYSAPQRASSHNSSGPINTPQQQGNPPPLMRANTTPSGQLLAGGTPTGYHHSNGYSSAPNHSQQHSPYAQSHSVSNREDRDSDVNYRSIENSGNHEHLAPIASATATRFSYSGDGNVVSKPLNESAQFNSSTYAYPATSVPLKHRNANTLLNVRGNAHGEGEDAPVYLSWNHNRGDAFSKQ